MSCDLMQLATQGVAQIQPYQAGKNIELLQRELGLKGFIKLGSNENPFGPGSAVLTALSTVKDISRYPDGDGFYLKQQLAFKHDVEPNQITLGNGSNDILEMVTRAFVTATHEVIYSQYSFAVYPIVTKTVGATAIVTKAKNWGHDLTAMLAAVTDKTRLIFIANPNNPTGTYSNDTTLKSLLENIPEHVLVVVDEAYFEYARSEKNYPDTSLWLTQFDNLIVARTFSKAYGLAGLRVGYALSHATIANVLNRVRQPFNNNSLALVAAQAALKHTDHIDYSVNMNALEMAKLIQHFDTMGLKFIPSAANFICVDLQQPAAAIYNALLKAGIIVRCLQSYDMPNHLRVSIGQDFENQRFIDALKTILAG